MGFFGRFDEEEYLNEDDGPMFGHSDRYEKRKADLERAKEIASGETLGKNDSDEVHELARKLKE